MAQVKFGSAGVSTREIDLTGVASVQPTGVPAAVIGTATRGPAFVPVTVGVDKDFYARFGKSDGKKFGPLALVEWLKNSQAGTYLRVLGVGDGKKRLSNGTVNNGGFTVGEQQPDVNSGILVSNPSANFGGPLGRTYFLGAFMSESFGSTIFSDAGLQGPLSVTPGVNTSVPIIRGILMAASGVILRVSSSYTGTNTAPTSTQIATDSGASGLMLGSVPLWPVIKTVKFCKD
jgi:hypothetical protein